MIETSELIQRVQDVSKSSKQLFEDVSEYIQYSNSADMLQVGEDPSPCCEMLSQLTFADFFLHHAAELILSQVAKEGEQDNEDQNVS